MIGTTLLSATLAATTPQYVIFHGEIVVDVDYIFAAGSIIIFAIPNSTSTIGNEGFRVRDNISFKLEKTRVFGKRPDCTDFYWRIRLSHGSKIEIEESKLDYLREMIPNTGTNQNVESIIVKNSHFTNNWNFITYVNSNALTTFHVLGSFFYTFADTTVHQTVWIDIENHAGTILINGNHTEDYYTGLQATDVASVQYTNNVINRNRVAFQLTNCNSYIVKNKLLDSYRRSLTFNCNVTLKDNYFYMINSAVPMGLFTFRDGHNKTLVAEDNVFDLHNLAWLGMYIFNSTNLTMNVDRNIFNFYNGSSGNDCFAISCESVNGTYLNIRENKIDNHLESGGIKFYNSHNIYVANNNIVKLSTLGQGDHALAVIRSSFIDMQSNILDGQISLADATGIHLEVASMNIAKCNRITSFNHGTRNVGNCVPTELRRNQYYANDYGITMTFSITGASIGPQINHHNTWNTPSLSFDLWDFYGCFTNHFQIHTMSSPYWPATLSGGCLTVGGSGPTILESCPVELEDPDPKDPERFAYLTPNEGDLLVRFQQDPVFYEQNGQDHHDIIQMIRHIHWYPQLLQDEGVEAFFNVVNQSSLGKLVQAELWLQDEANTGQIDGISELFEHQAQIYNELVQEDNEGLEEAIDNLNSFLPEILAIQGQSDQNTISLLEQKLFLINNLENSFFITDYYKSTLSLYFKYIINQDPLTLEEISFLEELSQQCFNEYGISVYLAKEIISDKTKVNHECNINKGADLVNSFNNVFPSDGQLTIIPTIGSDQIILKFNKNDQEENEYIIRDTHGRVYASGKVLSSRETINISKYLPQIYFVQITNKSAKTISQGKFIKL